MAFCQLQTMGAVMFFVAWVASPKLIPVGGLACFVTLIMIVMCNVRWIHLLCSTVIVAGAFSAVATSIVFPAALYTCPVRKEWLAFVLGQAVTVFVGFASLVVAPVLVSFGKEEIRGFRTMRMTDQCLTAMENHDLNTAAIVLESAADGSDRTTHGFFAQIITILRTYHEHLPHSVTFVAPREERQGEDPVLFEDSTGDRRILDPTERPGFRSSSESPAAVRRGRFADASHSVSPEKSSLTVDIPESAVEKRSTAMMIHFSLPYEGCLLECAETLSSVVETILSTLAQYSGVLQRGTGWSMLATFGLHHPVILHEQAAESCARSLLLNSKLSSLANLRVSICTGYLTATRYESKHNKWLVVGGASIEQCGRLCWLQQRINVQIIANAVTARALNDAVPVDLVRSAVCISKPQPDGLQDISFVYEIPKRRRTVSDKVISDLNEAFAAFRMSGKTPSVLLLLSKWRRESIHAERIVQLLLGMADGTRCLWLESAWYGDRSGSSATTREYARDFNVDDSRLSLQHERSDEHEWLSHRTKIYSHSLSDNIIIDSFNTQWKISCQAVRSGRTSSIFVCLDQQGSIRAAQVLHECASVDDVYRTIENLRPLVHEHLLKYYSSAMLHHQVTALCEFFPLGSLQQFLQQYGLLDISIWTNYIRDVVSALHFLHRNNVVHGAIRLSNLLLSDDGTCTLGGLVGMIDSPRDGSDPFCPPEQATSNHGDLTKAADIWALGVASLSLIFDIPESLSITSLRDDLADGRLKGWKASQRVSALILRCLETEPAKRAGTQELLALL
jgi:hypothetical protein